MTFTARRTSGIRPKTIGIMLAGDTAHEANNSEVQNPCREARDLKESVVKQTLELRLLKKA